MCYTINTMKRKIVLNGREVFYDLTYKKVKNLNLRIKPDMTVSVSASKAVSQKIIDEFLFSKADFILNALEKYESLSFDEPQKPFLKDGDDIVFLGEYKKLCVLQESKNSVFYDGYIIYLSVKDSNDYELKEKTLLKWKKEKCIDVVTEYCKKAYNDFYKFNLPYPEIKFRKMVSRWGSCQPRNNVITFNTYLINAPEKCIEYVVYHEFTHFLEPNHSKRFYEKLSWFIPDWKERKKMLNGGKYVGDL